MKKQVSIIWLIISAVLIILTGALLTYVYLQRSEMKNFKEQVNIEKERAKLEEEYTAIFDEYRQYENNPVWLRNDSLILRLDREKARVQRLLEELRNRKNIDAITIDSLQEVLHDLRSNIKTYQAAIDSLNRENRQLQAEKNDALQRYRKHRTKPRNCKKTTMSSTKRYRRLPVSKPSTSTYNRSTSAAAKPATKTKCRG